MKKLAVSLFIALLSALALLGVAQATSEGHITLLTVSDEARTMGGTADLYLRIEQGEGSIYIDSFPLTKVDTQSSIRYANQIACDMLQEDCSKYNFYYTIRANSAIVGGPSAGAAITVLTVATLDDKKLDQETAMTGTINSGGIIGPVAGISAKVRGARSAGMKKVLIPALTSNPEINPNTTLSDDAQNETANETENETAAPVRQEPLQQGKVDELSDRDTVVIRVGTVEQALYEFTGKNYSQTLKPLKVPDDYSENMQSIAGEICNRSSALRQQANDKGLTYNDTHNYSTTIANLSEGHYYSRASFCFSQNIELATLLLQNASKEERYELYRQLRIGAQGLENQTRNRKISTISDLETYAIVKERIIEAQTILDDEEAQEPRNLAYAQERLVSARSWSQFFGIKGEEVLLDQQYLQRACLAKLGEADERVNYVRLYAPQIVEESQSLLDEAQEYSSTEPILCIFTAAKAKAQANVMADALSIGQENVDALIQQKLDADSITLQKQQDKGFFPILGYSYTQYASDLRARMPYSALIFSEYSLELSNLDMYFPQKKRFSIPPGFSDAAIIFALGAIFGAGIAAFFVGRRVARTTLPRATNGHAKQNAKVEPAMRRSLAKGKIKNRRRA